MAPSLTNIPRSSTRRLRRLAAVTVLAGALGLGCGPVQELLTSPTATVSARRVVLPDAMSLRAGKVCLTLDERVPTGEAAAAALRRVFPNEPGAFFVQHAALPGDTLREQPRNLLNLVQVGDSVCYESRATQAYAAAHPTPTSVPTATPEAGAWCKRISAHPDGRATFATAWEAAQRLGTEHKDIPAARRTWYVRRQSSPPATLQRSAAITDETKLPKIVHADDAICLQVPQP